MNNERRKKIRIIINRLDKIIDEASEQLGNLDAIMDEEQDAFDNMPEGFQAGDRGIEIEEGLESLDDIHDKINESIDNLIDAMSELESTFF